MRFALVTLVLAVGTTVFAADSKIELSGKNTTIKFVGSKADGKHDGGFKTLTGSANIASGKLSKVEVDIETDSLYSDDNKLTTHLKASDFFDVKKHPKAKFVSTKIEDGKITGDLTLLGNTKSITFPAKISTDGGNLKIDASFKINRTDFGMTYGKGKINDDVAITLAVDAKK